MNVQRTFIAMALLVSIGLWMVLQGINHSELKTQIRDLKRDGYQLTNFLALHEIEDFKGVRKDMVLRTLLQHHRLQQMAYLIITDDKGEDVVRLSSGEKPPRAPREISEQAAASMVFIEQAYTSDTGEEIIEFVKPVFSEGRNTATVRLGIFFPPSPTLTLEKISLLATIGFYILGATIIAFFGFTGAMRPLARLKESILPTKPGIGPARPVLVTQDGVTESLDKIQTTWHQVQKKLDDISTLNRDLTTRVSVLDYEMHMTEAVLDHLDIGILVTDTQNNITQINAYLLNLFCMSRETVIDRPAGEVLRTPETDQVLDYLRTADISRNQKSAEVQFPEFAPGEIFRLSHSIIEELQRPIGKIFTLRAVTGEKSLERSTREFTAHLSHELLTPLTTIQSYSEMIADGEVSGREMRKEFINTIYEETTRLSRMIKDILSFSKIEGGTLMMEKGLVRSDWLLEGGLSAIEGEAVKKNITIERILPDNFPSLIGDKEQLKGCLINILGNAIKYTDRNGKIQFEISEMDSMVVFDIRDDGCGIAEEDLPYIFDKFFRSGHASVSSRQGTGLGLAIASEIVSLHNGSTEVQSRLGEGTLFTIRIPKEEYYLGKEDQSACRRRRVPHPAGH